METTKRSDYSMILYDRNLEQDHQFKQELRYTPKAMKESPKDFFNIFHQGKLEYSDNPNPVMKHFLEGIKETEDFKDLLEETEMDEASSYECMKNFQEEFFHKFVEGDPEMVHNLEDENPSEEAMEELENKRILHRAKMRKIFKKMNKDLEDLKELQFIGGYDLSKSTNKAEDVEMKKELIKLLKNNPFLKSICKMAGRAKRKAESTLKTRSDIPRGKIMGITQGDDLSAVLPVELAKMSDPDFQLSFLDRFCNKSLMQYHKEMEEALSEGAIVFCLDQSGSMGGDLNLFGCAIMFSMYLIAKKTKRDFYVIRFDEDIAENEIKSEQDLFDLMGKFLGGGTDFEKPLKRACEIIRDNEAYKKADIIFLTDCSGQFSDESKRLVQEMKANLRFKILTVVMGYEVGKLREVSDRSFSIANIYGKKADKAMEAMFNL